MRRVVTENSIYEINDEDRLIRRTHGKRSGTKRQGKDGVWQSYESIESWYGGMLIVWGNNEDGTARCTWTSTVLQEEKVE